MLTSHFSRLLIRTIASPPTPPTPDFRYVASSTVTTMTTRRGIQNSITRSEPVEPEPEPGLELEPKPEPEPYHHRPHPHPHHDHRHQHRHQHHYDLSVACPPTTTITTTAAAIMPAHPLDLDQSLHSFAPSIRAHSQSDLLDPPLAVRHHPASASSPSPSSFASSTNTNTNTNTDGGEQDTSPSSAPSLLNDTSSSLPQTPQTPSFRLDLHSTDFSAALKQQQQQQQQQQQRQFYYPNPIATATNDDGMFALFLAQRSPVLKACELCLLGLATVPKSFLTLF